MSFSSGERACRSRAEGDFYWVDIIGLSVFTVEGQYVGRVTSIMPTGSNDVYIVKNSIAGGKRKR